MKRMLSAIVITICCLLLAACAAPAPAASTPEPTPAPSAAPTEAPTPEPTAAPTPTPVYDVYNEAKSAAVQGLATRLSDSRTNLYVYKDYAVSENNFTQKAKIFGTDINLVKNLDENWTDGAYAGDSCIRCQVNTRRGDWGGWLFLNGYLPEGETQPKLNDGKQQDAGLDLTGATALRFYAKGEKGGEQVEFFTLGFGYDGATDRQLVEYPDSSEKRSLGFITLTNEWQEYVIDIEGYDLSYICCGFGFVCSPAEGGEADNVFYLDEIRFVGTIAAEQTAPVLLRSYDTSNVYIKNAAFSYDNALVAMAFLSEGMTEQAGEIMDAFVYAVKNDRQGIPRVRNAYSAGNIGALPGWASGARLPGWYDFSESKTGDWFEDRYQVGSNVGNTSYVALALLQYYKQVPSEQYLNTAKALMDWVIDNCSDSGDGFTGGFDGWVEGKEPTVFVFTYKSIEHNIDAYAAFNELYNITKEEKYKSAAESALRLIDSMYDSDQGLFYTGTTEDGVTANTSNIVLDAQVWSALALGDAFEPYEAALSLVDSMRVGDGGYPFCQSNVNGGWWAEGTAYTALMYRLRGNDAAATAALNALGGIQLENGLFPAATVENLSTGFDLFTGDPWVYGTDAHIAPAAWFIMAVNGFNPYAF